MSKTGTYSKYFFILSIIIFSIVIYPDILAMERSKASKLDVNTALAKHGASPNPITAHNALTKYNLLRNQNAKESTDSIEKIDMKWLAQIHGITQEEYNKNLAFEILRYNKHNSGHLQKQTRGCEGPSNTLDSLDDNEQEKNPGLIVFPKEPKLTRKKVVLSGLKEKFSYLLRTKK